jgi:transposase
MTPRFIKLHPRTEKRLKLLERKAATDGAYRVAKRIRAVLLNHQEKTSGEIARLLSSPRSRVSEWLKDYEEQGIDGLKEGHRSGRPSRLNDLQKIMICDILDSGPIAYGQMSGIWSAKIISQIIKDEFNVQYHPSHVWKLLQDFGFTVQSPKRLLAKADNEKRQKWIKETYPEIKKKLNANDLA